MAEQLELSPEQLQQLNSYLSRLGLQQVQPGGVVSVDGETFEVAQSAN
jgi:hypothetical protein